MIGRSERERVAVRNRDSRAAKDRRIIDARLEGEVLINANGCDIGRKRSGEVGAASREVRAVDDDRIAREDGGSISGFVLYRERLAGIAAPVSAGVEHIVARLVVRRDDHGVVAVGVNKRNCAIRRAGSDQVHLGIVLIDIARERNFRRRVDGRNIIAGAVERNVAVFGDRHRATGHIDRAVHVRDGRADDGHARHLDGGRAGLERCRRATDGERLVGRIGSEVDRDFGRVIRDYVQRCAGKRRSGLRIVRIGPCLGTGRLVNPVLGRRRERAGGGAVGRRVGVFRRICRDFGRRDDAAIDAHRVEDGRLGRDILHVRVGRTCGFRLRDVADATAEVGTDLDATAGYGKLRDGKRLPLDAIEIDGEGGGCFAVLLRDDIDVAGGCAVRHRHVGDPVNRGANVVADHHLVFIGRADDEKSLAAVDGVSEREEDRIVIRRHRADDGERQCSRVVGEESSCVLRINVGARISTICRVRRRIVAPCACTGDGSVREIDRIRAG